MCVRDTAEIPFSIIRERVDARPLNADTIVSLKESITRLGVLNPILVRPKSVWDSTKWVEGYEVIAGHHRRRACLDLGFATIPANIVEADDIAAELSMIAENLHRSELTALQRAEQVSRWIELTGTKREADEVLRQLDAKPGRPEGGVRAAARELGLSEPDARRSVQVASLSPEAKTAAVEMGLDDNRTALLAAAKEPTPERQVAKVKEWDTKRELELAKRAVAKKQIAEAVSVEAPAEFDGAADDLALFLIEHLPPASHREALQRLRAVSVETARAFADLALPDVPLGLTLAGSLARRAA